MRAGFGQFNVPTDEYLQYAAQFGATDVLLNTPQLPGGERWELYDLVKLRVRVESFGLKLTALENVPTRFYDHIMLNGPQPRRADREHDLHCSQYARGRNTDLRIQLDAFPRLADASRPHPSRRRRDGVRRRRWPRPIR